MISSRTNTLVPAGRNHSDELIIAPKATSTLIVVLFIAALLPPVYFDIGGTRLSFSRVFLLLAIVPLSIQILSGKFGQLMATDYLMIMYSAWLAITYTYHYGTARVGLSGITVIEQLGGYLLGRILIRNSTDYTVLMRAFFIALIVLFPFAVFEAFTGRNIWSSLFDPVFSIHIKGWSAYGRMGLERVMSGFEHPILFGLFCSLGVANFFYVYQTKLVKALTMAIFATGMTFMSLSSAPLLAVGSQFLLIIWDKFTKGRWVLLTVLVVFSYVTIDALSNRTPVTILISTLTFNPFTAWIRMSIWDYGYASVMAHPFMGIGLEDWPRPPWLTSSVDNFWLLISMRHGLPAILLLLGALVFHLTAILRSKGLPPTLALYRTGYVLALLSLYFSLCTVHIWGGMSSFVFFYIGAGLWFVGAAEHGADIVPESTALGQPITRSSALIAAASRNSGIEQVRLRRPAGLPQSRFSRGHKREPPTD